MWEEGGVGGGQGRGLLEVVVGGDVIISVSSKCSYSLANKTPWGALASYICGVSNAGEGP